MRAGCHVEVPREIATKRAVISVRTTDNECFAWSVIAALYPAEKYTERESSYPHYTAVLNFTNIEFPMILKDINKFEQLNDISINVYGIENKQVLPVRLTSDKKEKHINVLYLEDPRNDVVFHNLSGFDAHFIIKEIATAYDGQVDVLPITKEKYILFAKHVDSTKDKNENQCKLFTEALLFSLEWYHVPTNIFTTKSRTASALSVISKTYIQLNTNFRTRAKNDFEKNLFKLMNNAVFGKTMENVRNHIDVKLLTKWDGLYGAEAMIAKPNFHSRSIFAENLIVVELRKLEVKFNKPIYVGMCIFDISKVCLYEFHYDYMLPLFHDKCKIMYTDTDSLIYRIECNDAYESMKRDIARFDTSDYPADNAYGISLANKKVPGLMKDENNGTIMTEFVGLRAKMYTVRVDGKKDIKKAKGVKSNVVARTITFDDYTRCLNEEIGMTRRQSCIRSKLHEIYTISESKIALSPYDDKRYVVPDSTETLPWGHWRVPL
ncbi:hypothetical protein ALC57_00191 [Trachymyrmex cornetzi]|uniref:DNA-directed DNA polymerase n=1 Tax=Trachymyrmex cornetzi TaxID=471704 RepID=A0A151JSX3_9HYME|nr:hypothetical protein ALC57_00191 [Trachymyrmex cornetzi]